MYKWSRKGVRLGKGKPTVRSIVPIAVVCLLGAASPAYADHTTDIRVYNRMDGSRLAVADNGTAEGARVISLRSPAWQYTTARWTVDERSDGYTVFKNELANKCLQPGTANPVAGDPLVIRTCDGSKLQDWSRRAEETYADTPTGWGSFRPRLNPGLAITIATWEAGGSRDSLYLDADQNSTDRLWRLARGNNTWW